MDLTPDLKDAVIRIRDSIDRFAKKQGWARTSYRLSMDVNFVWYRFYVNVYSRAYDCDIAYEPTWYDEIYDHLEQDLKDDSGLFDSIAVIICPFRLRFGTGGPLGENHIRIDESLLNPGYEELEPTSQAIPRD
jgi:hypothetical protein